MSEETKAKVNEIVQEINRKVAELSDYSAQAPSINTVAEAALLKAEVINRLDVLQDIITELLEAKE